MTKQDTLFAFTGDGHSFVLRQPPVNGPSTGFYDVFPNGDLVVLASSETAGGSRANIIATLHWERALKSGTAASESR